MELTINGNITINGNVTVNENVQENGAAENNGKAHPFGCDTNLADIIAFLGDICKAEKTPTPKKLEESGSPIVAEADCCKVYGCGYAVYDNGCGRTVMWLPNCVSFTYHFVESTEAEKKLLPDQEMLPEGLLETLPWVTVITLIGEHRIEDNSMNRTGSRTGTKDYDSEDRVDKNSETEDAVEQLLEEDFAWRSDWIGENPETICIRREMRREAWEQMTEKQREVFMLYYFKGLKQREIAEQLGISKQSVSERLDAAVEKIKRLL